MESDCSTSSDSGRCLSGRLTRPIARLGAVAFTIAFAASGCSDSLSPPDPGRAIDESTIVFSMQDLSTTEWGLFTVRGDGSELREIEFSRENDEGGDRQLFRPRWSPNGRHLIYRSTATGTDDWYLVLMSASGSDRRDLTPLGGFMDFPFWGPFGDRVLYARGGEHAGGLGVLVQTAIVDTLGVSTDFMILDEGALFEGRRVYFTLSPSTGSGLYDAQWAPDGAHLFVIGFLDNPPDEGLTPEQVEIFKVTVPGGRLVERMTHNDWDEGGGFVVSPDGLRFAVAQDTENRRVYVARFEDRGSRPSPVTNLVPGSDPSWARDSRHLVVTVEDGVAIIDTQTGTVRRRFGSVGMTDPDIHCPACTED